MCASSCLAVANGGIPQVGTAGFSPVQEVGGKPCAALHDYLRVAAEREACPGWRRYEPPRCRGARHSSPEDVHDAAACGAAGDAKFDRLDALGVADLVGHKVWEDKPSVIG